MKKSIILISVFLLSNLSLYSSAATSNWEKISPTNVTSSTNQQYIISSGGNYTLTANIAPSTTSATSIIHINADNVTLDLAGHTIDGSNSETGDIAIEVSGHKNVTIKNGHIISSKGEAINIAANSDNVRIYNMNIEDTAGVYDAIITTTGTNFVFKNISIMNNTGSTGHGIHISGTAQDVTIENFHINGIATQNRRAIQLADGCYGVTIKKGTITNITGSTGSHGIFGNGTCYNVLISFIDMAKVAGTGISIGSTSHDIAINNCNISSSSVANIAFDTGCYGIILDNIQTTGATDGITFVGTAGNTTIISDVIIKNCTISGVTDTQNLNGLQFSFAENILIQNTSIGKCNTTATGKDTVGILFSTCTNIRCQKVKSGGHLGDGAYGFSLTNVNGAIFDNCESLGNHATDTTGTLTCVGFFVETSTAVTFNNCVSSGHTAGREAQGFLYSNATGCIAENCIANGIRNSATVPNTTAPMFAGFFSVNGIGNLWKNCIAENNFAGTGAGQNGTGAIGFYLSSELQSALIDCKARGHGSIYAHTANAIGIYLDSRRSRTGMKKEDCQYCQIRGCEASSNCTSATAGVTAYGIRDFSTDTTNIIVECFAFGNTDNASTRVVTNYSMDLAIGQNTPANWPRVETNMDSLIDLANTPDYYNVSITS